MNKHNPSKSILRFLQWFCPASLYESIEGDLLEQFECDLEEGGERKAKRKLFWNVLKFFRPGIILRNKFSFQLNHSVMIRNYLKVACRNLARHKLFAFINVTGLSLGITACLLIGIYIADELSFDRFHEKSSTIYRVLRESESFAIVQHVKTSMSPYVLARDIEEAIPEVEQTVRIKTEHVVVRANNNLFDARQLVTDLGFLNMFTFPVISKSTKRLIADPSSIAISRTAALRYFNEEEPLGRILQIRKDTSFYDYTVVAILQDPPANSTIQFDFIAGMNADGPGMDNYRTAGPETFVSLAKEVALEDIEKKIQNLYLSKGNYSEREISAMHIELEPLRQVHFNTDTSMPYATTNPVHIAILALVGLLILFLAVVTFTTLTLSQSTNRAKEVGVRKTMGARKAQLINQFYIEVILVAGVSFILGILMMLAGLPAFNQIVGKSFTVNLVTHSWFWISSALFVSLIALLAGSYPAIFMSGFSPAKVVKQEFSFVSKQQLIRALTSFQVVLTFIFLTGALIIYQQTEYIANKNLGFAKEYIIRIPIDMPEGARTKAMLESELANESSVKGIAASWQKFGAKDGIGYNYFPIKSGDQEIYGNALGASQEFASLFDLTLVQGTYFSKEKHGVLVNEALVKAFGWDNPIGKNVNQMFGFDEPIVGVVKDFHYQSLHEPVQPLVIHSDLHYSNIFVAFRAGDVKANLDLLKRIWGNIQPTIPFQFTFVDQDIQQHYETEQRWQKVILYASVLALLISCLGILGMANLTASRKVKEIGIRKVMGASIHSILLLLSKDYIKLMLISFFVAFPVVQYFISQWLNEFAYRIEIQWWMYALPGFIILSMALVAVCGQSWKAASINPVETLNYE